MDDVSSTVNRESSIRTDHESAVWIDAVRYTLHAALFAQQHANGATERRAALGIGGGEGGIPSCLCFPSTVEQLERREHSGDDRRTRGWLYARLPGSNRQRRGSGHRQLVLG